MEKLVDKSNKKRVVDNEVAVNKAVLIEKSIQE